MPLALADSAREGSAQVSFSLLFSFSLERELASSVRRRRCSRAPLRPAVQHLARAYGMAYWSEGRASAAITVLLPAGFCGCTSARSALHVPFLPGCNSPNAPLFPRCCVRTAKVCHKRVIYEKQRLRVRSSSISRIGSDTAAVCFLEHVLMITISFRQCC